MCSFSPYQTTAQNMAEVLDRDTEQRENQGSISRTLVSSRLVHIGEPGSGTCKHGAEFTYSNGYVEILWGM